MIELANLNIKEKKIAVELHSCILPMAFNFLKIDINIFNRISQRISEIVKTQLGYNLQCQRNCNTENIQNIQRWVKKKKEK